MNSSSEDIQKILAEDSSLGLTFGSNLFKAREPKGKEKSNCVTIFDTSTQPPQLTMAGQGEDYDYASIQIRVRNLKFVTGWNLAEDIKTSLHGRAQETINDTLYSLIQCVSGPALLDWDENNRARIIINFNIQRR